MSDLQVTNPSWDAVDEASDESFPASDPPAHGGVSALTPELDADTQPYRKPVRQMWPWIAGGAALLILLMRARR